MKYIVGADWVHVQTFPGNKLLQGGGSLQVNFTHQMLRAEISFSQTVAEAAL